MLSNFTIAAVLAIVITSLLIVAPYAFERLFGPRCPSCGRRPISQFDAHVFYETEPEVADSVDDWTLYRCDYCGADFIRTARGLTERSKWTGDPEPEHFFQWLEGSVSRLEPGNEENGDAWDHEGMDDFGVRFSIDSPERFGRLRELFLAIKHDKEADCFRADESWPSFVPDSVKPRFHWPTAKERESWLEIRDTTPIAVSLPAEQLGTTWDFFRLIEGIQESEYSLLTCERTTDDAVAEIHIDPWGYPYGGLGPFIALVEAFGFVVLGVNECGRYESRSDLQARRDD